MQPTAARPPTTTSPPLSIAGGVVAGTVLVVAGLALAYVAVAVPMVGSLAGSDRFAGSPLFGGPLTWALALLMTGAFLAVGVARLAEILAETRPRARPVVHPRSVGLPPDVVLALGLEVGDGRPIPELLIGRFGAAVVRELPPASLTRRTGPTWEARTDAGWVRIESPLDRATRDAERARRWFSDGDGDFVVRVYAAVLDPDGTQPRTPTCAVLTAAQLPTWLASLPVQRSLTDGRRAQLVARVRAGT